MIMMLFFGACSTISTASWPLYTLSDSCIDETRYVTGIYFSWRHFDKPFAALGEHQVDGPFRVITSRSDISADANNASRCLPGVTTLPTGPGIWIGSI